MSEAQASLFPPPPPECKFCHRTTGHTAGCPNYPRTPGKGKYEFTDSTADAIERARQHAREEWIQTAKHVLEFLARSQAEFTTADVDLVMQRDFPHVKTHDKRAMGPVAIWALREGLVQSTLRSVRDPRPNCNQGLCRVLVSLVYVPVTPNFSEVAR